MDSKHNEGKSVVAEGLSRSLENKNYKYMTSVSKNMFINNLVDTVNKYNNTYRKIKMMLAYVKSNMYIDFNKENKMEDPQFYVANQVKISTKKRILQMVTLQIGLKKFLPLKMLKNTVPWTLLLVILTVNKLLGDFTKKNYKKQSKESKVKK